MRCTAECKYFVCGHCTMRQGLSECPARREVHCVRNMGQPNKEICVGRKGEDSKASDENLCKAEP